MHNAHCPVEASCCAYLVYNLAADTKQDITCSALMTVELVALLIGAVLLVKQWQCRHVGLAAHIKSSAVAHVCCG